MNLEAVLLGIILGSLTISVIVFERSDDDMYSAVPALISGLLNVLILLLLSISDLLPTPNPVFEQELTLSGSMTMILIAGALSLASVALMFKLKITSRIFGDKLLLRDEIIATFHESNLQQECRFNGSRRTNFYLNYREGPNQFILPIKDLDSLSQILEKGPDMEEGITCCRCHELKPEFISLAHASDFKGTDWRPICKECTREMVEKAMEQEDNYISEELVVSRTV